MNLRQAEARVVELTKDVRAVEATAVKQRQNIIAEALTAADGLKLVREDAKLLTGRVTDAIKVGRERHDENKATFASILEWQKHTDLQISSLDSQIDCCQKKRWWFDIIVLGAFVPMWIIGACVIIGGLVKSIGNHGQC